MEKSRPRIIVPIRVETLDALVEAVKKVPPAVDILEIWIDHLLSDIFRAPFRVPGVFQAVRSVFSGSLLGVCKPPVLKGRFTGDETQQLQVLQQFLRFGGDFVDVDIRFTAREVIGQLPPAQTWLSYHDFDGDASTLPFVERFYEEMQRFDPFLYKFALTLTEESQLSSLQRWLQTQSSPIILTVMGPKGKEFRKKLLPYTWGTFAYLPSLGESASGQLTVEETLKLLNA